MSLRGVSCQIEVIGRKADGTTAEFAAFAPLSPSETFDYPGTANPLSVIETAPGAAHASAGQYHAASFPSALELTMVNRNGSYRASIATATNTHTLIGTGNEKGRSGPEYYSMKRYFCPFNLQGFGLIANDVNHTTCGAAVIYITRRVDFKGYIAEVILTGACLETPVVDFEGDKPENAGHIVYSHVTLNPNAALSVTHMDKFLGETGPNATHIVRPFNAANARHVLSPGAAPAWMFAVHDATELATKVEAILHGDKGFGIAYSGRGFHPGSTYGYGPNSFRWDSPLNWPSDSFSACESRAATRVNTLRSRVASGLSPDGNRSGTYFGFTDQNPNATGGNDIYGHGFQLPAPSFIGYLRLGAMCYSRRSNHLFFQWDGSRPLLPADALDTFYDPTFEIQSNVIGTMLHCGDTGAGTSTAMASCQFSCHSPVSNRILGQRGNEGGPTSGQQINGPETRAWNTQSGYTSGAAAEDVAAFSGYSHNLGHSPRFFGAREAWVFGLSGIGLEIALGYAAFAACHHLAWDPVPGNEDWTFSRSHRNLHAWGHKDKLGMSLGSGFPCARRRGYLVTGPNAGLGPLGLPTESSNYGQQTLDRITDRTVSWSIVWQASGVRYGNNSYRTAVIGQGDEHNPFILAAEFVARISTPIGITSSTGVYPGSVLPNTYADHPDIGVTPT